MGWRMGYLVKLVPALLVFTGSIALTAGLFVAVITMSHVPANHRGIDLPAGGAMYVGANTCFTCHGEQHNNWAQMLSAQPVTGLTANSHAGAVDMNVGFTIPPIAIGGGASADTINAEARYLFRQHGHHYVITAEPEQIAPASKLDAISPLDEYSDTPERCTDCHTVEPSAQLLRIGNAPLGCDKCHTRNLSKEQSRRSDAPLI